MTYSALVDYLINHAARYDSDFSDSIPAWVEMVTEILNSKLRVPGMVQYSYSDISGQFTAKPDGFLEFLNVQIETSLPPYLLNQVTPADADRFRADFGGVAGRPQYYSILGDRIELIPAPDTTYRVKMVYYKKLESPDENTTNIVLADNSSVYVHGCLMLAYDFTREIEEYNKQAQMFTDLVNFMNEEGAKKDFGPNMKFKRRIYG